MQWFDLLQKTTALLSRVYLVVVVCLASWAVLPLVIGWTPTVVMSGSMLPNVEIGDIAVAQPLTIKQQEEMVAPGHVLLYADPSQPNRLVTHRVVNVIKGHGYITKGDANAKADPAIVPIANVQGIERIRIPMIGIPIQTSRQGNFAPMVVFAGVTILAQIVVMHDKKLHNSKTSPASSPRHKKGRHRASTGHPTLARTIGILLTTSGLLAISLFVASSAALFSGGTSNSGNTFTTMADFSQAN